MPFITLILLASIWLSLPVAAQEIPDLTKGGKPDISRTNPDWFLHCAGSRGWAYRNKAGNCNDARQILITRKPTDAMVKHDLKVGDVILGVNGKLFSGNPITAFRSAAKSAAESRKKLTAIVWRKGWEKEKTLTLDFAVIGIPDLTKGEKLTRRISYLIGPAGFSGQLWRPREGTDEHKIVRQMLVTKVEKGSPADEVLVEGDVILGADGKGLGDVQPFNEHPTLAIANAIDDAEAKDPATLRLLVWRSEKSGKSTLKTVSLTLKTLGSFSRTSPYDCPKSNRILQNGLKALRAEESSGRGALGILPLLAGDDPKNPENALNQAKAKEWAHQLKITKIEDVPGSPWNVGNSLITLAEYYLKTRDEEMYSTLELYAQRYANGQSWFGTTGHRWADARPDGGHNGAMPGYGALNASGLGGFLGLTLAHEAGVDTPEVKAAIKRAETFFSSYAYQEIIPYGEHPAAFGGKDVYDYNGHSAVAALALSFQENRQEEARWFSKMSTAAIGKERVTAHAGPFFAQMWNPLGAALGGEKAVSQHVNALRWHLTLNRRWDGGIHYRGDHHYPKFSRSVTQLLIYALPLRQLHITGKKQPESLQFSDKELEAIRATRAFDPGQLDLDTLVASLSSWSPPDRTKAADELARRAENPEVKAKALAELHALAVDEKSKPLQRAGACYGLSKLKDPSSVDVLVSRLTDDSYLVRRLAAEGLVALPKEAVRPHINTILDVAVKTAQPTFPLVEGDPLQFAHGGLNLLLFGKKSGLLGRSIDGVDREKLWPAVRALARTPTGSNRRLLGSLYEKLSKDDTFDVLDVIVESVLVKAPADSMFAAEIRHKGINVLMKYSFEDMASMAEDYGGMGVLSKFDESVLSLDSARDTMAWVGEQQLVRGNDASGVLKALTTPGSGPPTRFLKMKKIHSITPGSPTITLPSNQTELHVKATNYAINDETKTIYTWCKIYGAGKVTFTPNATWNSNRTVVEFTDNKPGMYRFEVTMADTLGYTVARETVDVTLTAKNGLPPNRPPVAESLKVKAVPGLPVPITLVGRDPDGDELGYVITRKPNFGRLMGSAPKLTYIADFGHNGEDSFAFTAIDGQGVPAKGEVRLSISDRDVGVTAYEGFDYAVGPLNGCEGGSSFGFSAPWKIAHNYKEYSIADGSFSYDELPSTGKKLTNGTFHHLCSRALDRDTFSKHKLLSNGHELWFSVIIGFTQARYSNFRCWFGLREDGRKDGSDLGFMLKGGSLSATIGTDPSGTSHNYSGKSMFKLPPKLPHMIIGRCIWGKTDEDKDTLEIYKVFDAPRFGPMVLEKPVCRSTEVIQQEKLDSVYIKGTPGYLDEIRIGPTRNSVMLGTKPLEIPQSKMR